MKFNLWLKALLCTAVFAVGGLDSGWHIVMKPQNDLEVISAWTTRRKQARVLHSDCH